MNARIQVEHPVTELVTGLDLVALQIAVAEGRQLPIKQSDVEITGHALECRITAEDWRHDFSPSPGTITAARFPAGDGIRVDTHIESGAQVPPYYDSLLAKIIVHGCDRAQCVRRMKAALANCHIEGVATNVALHALLLDDPDFLRGAADTATLPRWLARAASVTVGQQSTALKPGARMALIHRCSGAPKRWCARCISARRYAPCRVFVQ